jgi:hypothetical protein
MCPTVRYPLRDVQDLRNERDGYPSPQIPGHNLQTKATIRGI